MNNEPEFHKSVMVDEVVSALHIKNQAYYIDATLGTGGHALAILRAGGKVLGIDMDVEMLKNAKERIEAEIPDHQNYKLVQGNFSNIDRIVKSNGWFPVAGIILDLGVSNLHLKSLERGFSFDNPDANLDMRIDQSSQGVTGADLLNALRLDQLKEMFEITMERGPAVWLSKKISEYRELKRIEKVGDFLEICEGLRIQKKNIRSATLPFLALRIAVNSELDNLREVLPKAYDLLEEGGKLVVITFHSCEDKIVKAFAQNSNLVLPNSKEIEENNRARSAKMRVITKN